MINSLENWAKLISYSVLAINKAFVNRTVSTFVCKVTTLTAVLNTFCVCHVTIKQTILKNCVDYCIYCFTHYSLKQIVLYALCTG